MLTRISLATALALGLMAAPAMANEMDKDKQADTMNQSPSATTGQGMSQSGQDGMQSASLQNRFGEIDVDGDGAISRSEWLEREMQLDNPPNFTVMNADNDDKLTRQEWDNHFGNQGAGTTGAGQQMDQQQDQQKQQ